MKTISGLICWFAFAGSATVICAQDHPPPMPAPGQGQMRMYQMPTFADFDKNKDKKLTRDELPGQFSAQMIERFDTNRDGAIDEEEWNAMRRGGMAVGGGPGGPRVGESMTKLLDGNADGKVSQEEFGKIVSLFATLDKDQNGELTQEEMNGFFRAVNEAQTQATGGVEVNNLFEKYDKNKDTRIAAAEMDNERVFKSLDLNKDGEVTRAEADTALKQLKKASEAKKTAQAPNN